MIFFIKLQLHSLQSAFNYNITYVAGHSSVACVSQNERWCKKDEQWMENLNANHCVRKYESRKAFLFLWKHLIQSS